MEDGTSYSAEFTQLINDPENVRKLIEGSFVTGVSFEEWKKERSPIVQAINKDGTILDIGCANGFLLRCLQAWSPHKLDPYGIDIEGDRINEAKELFKTEPNHFVKASIRQLDYLENGGLPDQYDFVYWNVWDNKDFNDQLEIDWLEATLRRVKPDGRLILGFYDSDKTKNVDRVDRLIELGYKISSQDINDLETKEIFIWIDR